MNEKFCILIKISLIFVLKCPINKNPALVKLLAWPCIYAALGGDELACCGLVRPYCDRSGSTLGQVMAYCVMAPKPLSNPMLTSDLVRHRGIYMGVISLRVPKVLVCIMSFKINLKLLPQVPETNKFKKIDIFQCYVSEIFANHQWLKHEHPKDLTQYSFASIPALFRPILHSRFLSPTAALRFRWLYIP